LARVILEKIEQAAVFVGDVTPVGTVPGTKAGTAAKKVMNPNVAIELGYSLHSLTDRALLMVMNEHYGSRDDLPFDLRSKAGPIMFRLAPNADGRTRTAEGRQLTAQFVEALKPFIGQHIESVRQQRPFPEAQAKDGPARFREAGQPLGMRDGVGFIDAGVGNDIFLASGAAIWLRVIPAFDPGKKWSSTELKTAVNGGISLPTLIGPANGMRTLRAADGVGICIVYQPQEEQTDHVTFAFESGEVWAISNYPLRDHPNDIFVAEIEGRLIEQLPRYGHFLRTLGLQPPYKWIAGVSGVRGRELQYPVAPNSWRVPGWGSHKCTSENISGAGIYDMAQSALGTLLPFFRDIYNKCGVERPGHLPVV
jgi:hypothetical protein